GATTSARRSIPGSRGRGSRSARPPTAARPSWVRAYSPRPSRPRGRVDTARALPDAARGRRDRWRGLNDGAEPQFPPRTGALRLGPTRGTRGLALVAELARDWFVPQLGGSRQSSVRH